MNDPTGQGYTVTNIEYIDLNYLTGIDDFTYTVTDRDGHTSSAHLYIPSDSYLEGEALDNTLQAGSGGQGADVFAFSAEGGEGSDTISDFSLADGDVLRFYDVLDGPDGDVTIDVDDLDVSVSVNGDNVELTINGVDGTTHVTLEGINSTGTFNGDTTLGDLIDSGLQVQVNPDTYSS